MLACIPLTAHLIIVLDGGNPMRRLGLCAYNFFHTYINYHHSKQKHFLYFELIVKTIYRKNVLIMVYNLRWRHLSLALSIAEIHMKGRMPRPTGRCLV